jgi:hypothetical protein
MEEPVVVVVVQEAKMGQSIDSGWVWALQWKPKNNNIVVRLIFLFLNSACTQSTYA